MAPNDNEGTPPGTVPLSQRKNDDARAVPPAYWMEGPDGELYAASTEIDRVNLQSAGYKVSNDAPKGMPKATGGVQK